MDKSAVSARVSGVSGPSYSRGAAILIRAGACRDRQARLVTTDFATGRRDSNPSSVTDWARCWKSILSLPHDHGVSTVLPSL